ncbi:MAG: divergent polysaccharide deacetylase family protein [Acidobacteriota bacterium]
MNGRERARSSFQTIAILAAIPLAGLAAFFLWQWLNGGESPGESYQEARAAVIATTQGPIHPSAPHAAAAPGQEAALPRVHRKPRRGSGDIVLIIDDLGFDGQPLERLMALDPNVNYAILPNGTRAAEFADRLNDRGFEILCHLPMEPQGHEAPGRNAILTSMTDEEITRTTRENIEAIPHARGVNNHMGSRATSDRRVMGQVLRAIPEGMYFIDSRTGGGSVAGSMAREMNVRTATRNVFLDDVATPAAVRHQLDQLASAAERRGIAVGIGHPYPVTLRVLTEELPELRARGFRFVRASEAVR